jgi:hypothetical protein
MITSDRVYNYSYVIGSESGNYPSKDDCFEVTFTPNGGGESSIDFFMPKIEVEFLRLLGNLKDNLTRPEIESLIKIFDKWGDYKYTRAEYDISLVDAGEAL